MPQFYLSQFEFLPIHCIHWNLTAHELLSTAFTIFVLGFQWNFLHSTSTDTQHVACTHSLHHRLLTIYPSTIYSWTCSSLSNDTFTTEVSCHLSLHYYSSYWAYKTSLYSVTRHTILYFVNPTSSFFISFSVVSSWLITVLCPLITVI